MKKILTLLAIFSVFTFSTSINAEEISTDEQTVQIIDIPQEEINRTEQIQLQLQRPQSRTEMYDYKTELVGTDTAVKVKIGYAENQPINGTVFNSSGGFYWSEGGTATTVSFTVAYGGFSLGVTPGKSGSTGTFITSPYSGTPVKLLIHKDIEVKKYKQYREPNMGTTAPWEYIGDVYTKVPTKNYLTVVKVS